MEDFKLLIFFLKSQSSQSNTQSRLSFRGLMSYQMFSGLAGINARSQHRPSVDKLGLPWNKDLHFLRSSQSVSGDDSFFFCWTRPCCLHFASTFTSTSTFTFIHLADSFTQSDSRARRNPVRARSCRGSDPSGYTRVQDNYRKIQLSWRSAMLSCAQKYCNVSDALTGCAGVVCFAVFIV